MNGRAYSVRMEGAKYGANFDSALAIAISYTTNHSILWAIITESLAACTSSTSRSSGLEAEISGQHPDRIGLGAPTLWRMPL
jgi:hypothetical protein